MSYSFEDQLRDIKFGLDQFQPQLEAFYNVHDQLILKGHLEEIARLKEAVNNPGVIMNSGLEEQINNVKSLVSQAQPQLDTIYEAQQQWDLNERLCEVARFKEAMGEHSAMLRFKELTESSYQAVQVMIQRQCDFDKMEDKLRGYGASFSLASHGFFESLAPVEALLEEGRLKSQQLLEVIQPQIAYQEFALQQLDLASRVSDIVKNNHLQLVDSASVLLSKMSSRLEIFDLMYPAPIGDEEYFQPVTMYIPMPRHSESVASPVVNIYVELTSELAEVDFSDEALDVEGLVFRSNSAQVVDLGSQILRLVYELNVESEREGRPALFKPTSKMYPACGIVSTRVAADEASFGEVVDQLYFLLYEGSGYAARLLERCLNDHLAALWRLKDLRTGIRHDIDHGDNRSIKKKNREIGEAYRSLVGVVIPRSRADWISAQVALYRQLVDMLELIRREAPLLRGG
jgi:hypothetical protein